jgi:hypothetical protein
MSMSTAFANALLLHYFNNSAHATVGDASGLQPSAVAGSMYVHLHTADPGAGGTSSTSAATFGGYAAKAAARSGAGWTVSTNTVTNAATVQFDECTSGSETITHFSICTGAGPAAQIIVRGALGTSRLVQAGSTLLFNAGELDGTVATS